MSKEKLFQSLKDLEENTEGPRKTNAIVERILNSIFYLGKYDFSLNKQETELFFDVITRNFRLIQGHIERVGCIYRTRLDTGVLRKRSALQFIIDKYCTIPGSRESLLNVGIQEIIAILDNIICKWHNESDSDEVDSDRDMSRIPNSHTWWQL